jgi:predicted nucleic acid-binding protein
VRFWDSSALVPLLVREETTQELLQLYQSGEVVAWWGSDVECASAVARLERSSLLEPTDTTEALRRLRRLAEGWHLVEPSDAIKELATRLLRVHDLRAADSLQLASAITASEQRPSTLEFVSRDQRLTLAAEREGFTAL